MFFMANFPPYLDFLYLDVDAPISTNWINLKFACSRDVYLCSSNYCILRNL